MSHEQRLSNLGIPSGLPQEEEDRLLRKKLVKLELELERAKAEFHGKLQAKRTAERDTP